MNLTYVLVVSTPVYGRQTSLTAYRFANALVKTEHTLTRVFFYQDGVTNASSLTVPANDEFALVTAWQTLSKKHGVELETCVAAALRRGQVSNEEAKQYQLSSSNMASGFMQTGLGGLSESLLTADRIVQF
ncbi:sulfurtransferase complex subunit TusD [Candidatus Enterovibrio altilux]|uniref:Sulfurtransferase TusD homolog n=1 Tax=Candidatus Enterovibrio altilux TaxID=1927128 RepID=A0A291BA19_9GAMM|nr:sulfurtransferase complex subunit TusD [Candidatus Enterovibrio luxaltus]ATF09823.1 tRNA 5-methylaminomethyl-2-thiouridine synthase TusD [Candidatus Enterovibrio luxaltus]